MAVKGGTVAQSSGTIAEGIVMPRVENIVVAGQRVDPGMLWHALTAYAADEVCVLRWYDQASLGPVTPAARIDLAALGRLHFIGTGLTGPQAAQLLEFNSSRVLMAIPDDATLVKADPGVDGGLYDAAEDAHRAYLAVNRRFGPTLVSAALALLRPQLFPILTAPVRMLYAGPAERAWAASQKAQRPFSRRTFWPVIRHDIITAQDDLLVWRNKLTASENEAERWLANVSDVRLWGIATRALAAGTVPGSR